MENMIYSRALKLYEEGNYDGAINTFKLLPLSNHIKFCIATCYKDKKDITSLKNSLKIFIQLHDDNYFDDDIKTNFISLQTFLAKYYVDQSDYDKAISSLKDGLKYLPDNDMLVYNIGHLYKCIGDYSNGLNFLKKALSKNNKVLDTYYDLVNIYSGLKEYDNAIICLKDGLKNVGDHPQLYNELGILYSHINREQAIKYFDKAESLTNDNKLKCRIKINHGHLFTVLGDWKNSTEKYKEAMKLDTNNPISYQNYLLDILYDDTIPYKKIVDEHLRLGVQICKIHQDNKIKPHIYKNDKICLGYVSGDFFDNHPVTYFIKNLLINYDKTKFQIYCYSNGVMGNTENYDKEIKWRNIKFLSLNDCVKLINEDRINILIDLSGHTDGNRMDIFSNTVTKLQISGIGYPCITGLPTIDYHIVDETFDLPKYKLFKMPHCYTHYYIPFMPTEVISPYHKYLRNYVTFGCLNKPNKINQKVIDLWDKLLDNIPESKLMIKQIDPHRFRNHNRIIPLKLVDSYKKYIEQYNQIDLTLDPFPYSGTTTTCESLLMGTPVITIRDNIEGKFHQNTTSSILINSCLSQYIIQNPTDYFSSIFEIINNIKQNPLYKNKVQLNFTHGNVTDSKLYISDYEKILLEKYQQVS